MNDLYAAMSPWERCQCHLHTRGTHLRIQATKGHPRGCAVCRSDACVWSRHCSSQLRRVLLSGPLRRLSVPPHHQLSRGTFKHCRSAWLSWIWCCFWADSRVHDDKLVASPQPRNKLSSGWKMSKVILSLEGLQHGVLSKIGELVSGGRRYSWWTTRTVHRDGWRLLL